MKPLLLIVSVAACYCALSCAPKITPPTAPPPSPAAVTPRVVVNYWFSRSQKATLVSLSEINSARFQAMFVNGVEYTECHATNEPIGRFSDYVLVESTDDGPCGRNAGDWE